MKYGAWLEVVEQYYHEVEADSPEQALELIRTGHSVRTDYQSTSNIGDVEQQVL